MPMPSELPAGADLLSDEELVGRVRQGDTPLFEILMRRNNQRLYRAVRAVVRDESEAEDVMQQAYVSAFAHLDQFAGQAKFSTWLLRIGVNEALGRMRQRRRHLERIDERAEDDGPGLLPMEAPMPTPEDRAANRELASLLESTIDALPSAYRAVFMLRLVEGLDTAETAAVLELGEEAVKQRLHRARAMVQHLIQERVGASAAVAFELHAVRCDRVVAAVMARLPAGSSSARPASGPARSGR
jgi:RNA polymerase sigma-70 factor (ECF subfamily)